jgi:hypothetical protein
MNNWILVFIISVNPGVGGYAGGPATLSLLTQAQCEKIGKAIVAKWGSKPYTQADYVCIDSSK